MYLPDISSDRYSTDPQKHQRFKNSRFFKGEFWFYLRYSLLVIWSGLKFLVSKDPQKAVTLQALRVMRITEKQGIHLTFEGLNNYPAENGPYVFACNHKGTFEVNALPGLVASRIPMTFVIKASLLKTPFFGQVVKRLKAIPVKRKHPGEDLNQVLKEGTRLLKEGVSVILFPESTRQDVFKYSKFNSLAIKLAVRAGVSVVPVALRTDCWGVGKRFKDYGPLRSDIPCNIAFGVPVKPIGRGKNEHRQILEFIADRLESWGSPVDRETPLKNESENPAEKTCDDGEAG